MIEIIDNIIDELEQGNTVAGIYLDLSKAFDTVDHSILIEKLHHYGIRGLPLEWLTDYLRGRNQYTVINGIKSKLNYVKYGVPQGSVLGPLLFLIYVNDISSATGQHKLRLFADDSNAFVVSRDPAKLKQIMIQVINNLREWFCANKLTINMDKTAYTIFSKNLKNIPESLRSLQVHGVTITKVANTKYLGLTLDEKICWEPHIEKLTGSLSKTIQAFKIIKNHVSSKNKLMLYYAYIYSRIQYGIEVYSQANKKKHEICPNQAE